MFQHTKYLAGTVALLLGASLFAAEFNEEGEEGAETLSQDLAAISMTSAVAPATLHTKEEVAKTSQDTIDVFNTYYVMKNPYKEHTEEDLASYHRYLSAKIQPGERPENVPLEAIYTKDSHWILLDGAKIIGDWNLDGTPHLAAAIQPEKPENVPVEAIYSDKTGYNAWIVTKRGSIIDAWNLDTLVRD